MLDAAVVEEKKLDEAVREDAEPGGMVDGFAAEVGAPGGWWRSRKRAPVPVTKAEM
jgi:hypothetical protein